MRASIGVGPVDVSAGVDLNRDELIVFGGLAALAAIAILLDTDSGGTRTISDPTGWTYESSGPGSAGLLTAISAGGAVQNGEPETWVNVRGALAAEGILGSILVWLYILPYIIVNTVVGIIAALLGILLQLIGLIGDIISDVLSMRPLIGLICALRVLFGDNTGLCDCIACGGSG
jgi:hypothetical protein